jgi:hypothetical protein
LNQTQHPAHIYILLLLLLPLSLMSLLPLLLLLLLQTKDTLTIKASSFGSKCELTPQLMDKVAKCGVMDNILSFAAFKNQKQLTKSDGAKRSRLTGATGGVVGAAVGCVWQLRCGGGCSSRGWQLKCCGWCSSRG